MRGILKSVSFWFAISAAVFLVVAVVSSVVFWGWLHPKDSQTASNSETVRNLGLLIGGGLAFVFALWRGWVAERQAATAQRHAEIARQQAATSERGLLNERYQKGAEMLGSDVLSVRLGGIYALQHLAEEHPEHYHVQIMRLFCAFVRNPTADKTIPDDPNAKVREDVQAVMDTIGTPIERHLRIERDSRFRLNLQGAYLGRVSLSGANLSSGRWSVTGPLSTEDELTTCTHTDLSDANLYGAILMWTNLKRADLSGSILAESWMKGANLSGADLTGTDLSGADLTDSNLSGANLLIANLSGAILTNTDLSSADLTSAKLSGTEFSFDGENPAIGLTQSKLDSAWPQIDNPPNLDGVVDAETGKQLVWSYDSLQDDADGDC